MLITRRRFIQSAAASGALAAIPAYPAAATANPRSFHLCLSPPAIAEDPELLQIVREAGVSTIWVAAYLYGYWYTPPDQLLALGKQIEAAGMQMQVATVPLGHPGDSLGAKDGDVPLTPPAHWLMATSIDGSRYSGTSLHPPATEENVAAVRQLVDIGFNTIFLDDDFRLARGPGVIGGCFCDAHKRAFLESRGFPEALWEQLLRDVKSRTLSPVLREWVEFTCDELSGCFRAMQAAAPGAQVGNMIMYLGAEKAGIRLNDYRQVPFRVGEMMFHDTAFGTVKGKTDELFRALFHRRYAQAHLAYSETTAFPADKLSAKNMAAKLAVSTITDVRNTMMMSGLSPFPRTHWETLAPAMRKQAALHKQVAGLKPQGPLKHYWGEASRYVGDDNPYSLFLSMGIPFQVVDELPGEGWTFLSDADSATLANTGGHGGVLVAREAREGMKSVPESLESLYALKREIVQTLKGVPYVQNEIPVVCAWYPEQRKILLWNLTEDRQEFKVVLDKYEQRIPLEGLDSVVTQIG